MRKKKKVTLKSIAKTLGVSAATVSKALRGSSDISDEMKKDVKKLATKLGYRPNLMARTLLFQRSYLLGVIIPDLRISFFSEVTRGIYEQARLKGYTAILMVNDENPENEKRNLEFLSDLHVDGILLNPAPGKKNFDTYKQLVAEGFPIVCYDRRLDEFGFSSVTVDDRKAAFELTLELIQSRRRNIVILGPTTGISVAEHRYQGYLDALNFAQIPLNQDLVVQCDLYIDDAFNKMKAVLNQGIKPDAVLCIGGLVAYGAGSAILESGLSIPNDICLAEFGDNDIIARLGVSFMTINQNPYIIGKTAVDLLVDEIENEPTSPKHLIIETKLLHHQSSRKSTDLN
jgi:DNA-binding LacI/PurR family transcriptional regulator